MRSKFTINQPFPSCSLKIRTATFVLAICYSEYAKSLQLVGRICINTLSESTRFDTWQCKKVGLTTAYKLQSRTFECVRLLGT